MKKTSREDFESSLPLMKTGIQNSEHLIFSPALSYIRKYLGEITP